MMSNECMSETIFFFFNRRNDSRFFCFSLNYFNLAVVLQYIIVRLRQWIRLIDLRQSSNEPSSVSKNWIFFVFSHFENKAHWNDNEMQSLNCNTHAPERVFGYLSSSSYAMNHSNAYCPCFLFKSQTSTIPIEASALGKMTNWTDKHVIDVNSLS